MRSGAGTIVVADLGGSNIDLLLATTSGNVVRTAVRPARGSFPPEQAGSLLDTLLPSLALSREQVDLLVVTGGRHRALPDELDGVPLRHVDELAAIAFGGLVAAGVDHALVVSMGTGTAMVSTDGTQHRHAIGLALGGGTLLGLSHRLLGTTDPLQIAALAQRGSAARANLTIADVIGSGVGNLPGDAPAAYLARLAGDRFAEPAATDLAAALLHMIGQVTGHLALLTARGLNRTESS